MTGNERGSSTRKLVNNKTREALCKGTGQFCS